MIFFPLRDDNPIRIRPWVTYALIATNIVVFLWQRERHYAGEFWIDHWYGLVPSRFFSDPEGESITVFTSMFMHGGFYHLGSNLWFLHVFGDNLEEKFGRVRYLLFYFASGIAAAAAQVAMSVDSSVPMVGASGAVAGVVGGYMMLYPRAPILSYNMVPLLWLLLGIFLVVPAWLIAGSFFVSNLFAALIMLPSLDQAGVAFFAHLGGFVAGIVITALFVDRSRVERRVAPTWKRARRERPWRDR